MLKVGILGTGWVSAFHVRALRELGIEIFAVVGSTREKAEAFAEEWNIPHYGEEPEMLFDPQISAVHICTPPHGHYEQIRLLLEEGKHIFCEKPLSLWGRQARELAQMEQTSGLVCCVGFNTRFYAMCRKGKALVEDGKLGKLLLIHGSYLQEFGAEPALWSWRYENEFHTLTEIGSHWLDLAQYISGQKIVGVSAVFDQFHPMRYRKGELLYTQSQEGAEAMAVPSEDVALIHFRTEKGAIGSVVLSELSHGHENRLCLELTGEKATLTWNSETPTKLSLSHKGQTTVLSEEDDSFDATFLSQFREFYKAVRGEKPFAGPTFKEASENVLLCEAIGQSAKNQSLWVEVSL